MLAWEGFNRAKAASYAEAALVLNVSTVAAGFAEPERAAMEGDIVGYASEVITVEWPAQAEGRRSDRAGTDLNALDRMAVGLKPSTSAKSNVQAQLLTRQRSFGAIYIRVETLIHGGEAWAAMTAHMNPAPSVRSRCVFVT